MPVTPGGIPHHFKSYECANGVERQTSTLTCLVRYHLAAAFEQEMLGTHRLPQLVEEGSGVAINRKIPARDPFRRWLVCVNTERPKGIGNIWEVPAADGTVVPHYLASEVKVVEYQTTTNLDGSTTLTQLSSSTPNPSPNTAAIGAIAGEVPGGGGAAPGGADGAAAAGGTEGGDTPPNEYDAPNSRVETPHGTYVPGYAEVALHFESTLYDVRTDAETDALDKGELSRYVVRESRAAMEAQTITAPLYYRASPTDLHIQQLGENATIINPLGEHTYAWLCVPKVPKVAIAICLGSVNSQRFDDAYDPETLLLQSARVVPHRSHYADILYRIEYNFLERHRDTRTAEGVEFIAAWNEFRTNDGYYHTVTADPTANIGNADLLVYKANNFDELFRFDAES